MVQYRDILGLILKSVYDELSTESKNINVMVNQQDASVRAEWSSNNHQLLIEKKH